MSETTRMSKADLVAALQSDDFDREALVQQLLEEQAKTAPFRERAEVRTHIDAFNEARSKAFQPAIYKKDTEALATGLKGMISALEAVAEAAGVDLAPAEED